jgi:hypothetical protein
MNLRELLGRALDGEVDALGIVWGVAAGTAAVAVRLWDWMSSRVPLEITIEPMPPGKAREVGWITVLNRSNSAVHIWRVYFIDASGKEDVIHAGDDHSLPSLERTSFSFLNGEPRLRTCRKLVVEISPGRRFVVRKRALRAATHLARFMSYSPWRQRLKWWFDRTWPGRAQKIESADRAAVRLNFVDSLNEQPPTRPWPEHPAAQHIIHMMYVDEEYGGAAAKYHEMYDELRALYEERLKLGAPPPPNPPPPPVAGPA